MVGPLKLIKILHCRSHLSSSKNSSIKKRERFSLNEINGEKKYLGVFPHNLVKAEVLNEDLCRVCLHKGSIPIYGCFTREDISIALCTFAAIEINEDDPYPKYLCQSCNALLQSAILFRKTAQESDKLLKNQIDSECSPLSKKDIKQQSDGSESEPIPAMDTGFEYDFETDDERKEVKEKINQLTCKRCDLQFKTFEEYNKHRVSDDHLNKKVSCPICNKIYKHDYLKKHMNIHNMGKGYMCDICGKLIICQNRFKRHHLTHFYDLPIKCQLCPYRGRFPESLKMHMRRHTGEKPYQCGQCSSRFLNKSNLNKHMLTHKAERDFKCLNNNCGKEFHTKRQLELHVRVVHAGVLDYKCRYCDKAFGYRRHMMKHERKVHKRDKVPYGIMPLYMQADIMKKQSEDDKAFYGAVRFSNGDHGRARAT